MLGVPDVQSFLAEPGGIIIEMSDGQSGPH